MDESLEKFRRAMAIVTERMARDGRVCGVNAVEDFAEIERVAAALDDVTLDVPPHVVSR